MRYDELSAATVSPTRSWKAVDEARIIRESSTDMSIVKMMDLSGSVVRRSI